MNRTTDYCSRIKSLNSAWCMKQSLVVFSISSAYLHTSTHDRVRFNKSGHGKMRVFPERHVYE